MRVTHAESGATALVTLNAMLGYDRDDIRPMARQLWTAPPMTRHGHPLERCGNLCAAMTLILERPEVRARLDCIELDVGVPDLTLVWDHGSRVTFAPFATPRAYRRRVASVAAGGFRRCRLPATSLDEIAALMEDDAP